MSANTDTATCNNRDDNDTDNDSDKDSDTDMIASDTGPRLLVLQLSLCHVWISKSSIGSQCKELQMDLFHEKILMNLNLPDVSLWFICFDCQSIILYDDDFQHLYLHSLYCFTHGAPI